VSPVFDVARRYRLVDVTSGEIGDQAEHVVLGEPCRELVELRVDQVICAGITRELKHRISSHEIVVLAGYCGTVDQVIEAHVNGRLSCGEFTMPGAGRQHAGPSLTA
jgi:predicted Fe-Mo cluster-binding NifX family protein